MSTDNKNYRKDLIRNFKREYTQKDAEEWAERVTSKEEYYDVLDTSDIFDDEYFERKRET
jgi:hypothetical protein